MNKVYQNFKKVINKTYQELINKVIVKTGDIYVLYNEYAVFNRDDIVTVFRRRDEKEFKFYSMKHAVTWAILDKNDRFYDSIRVHNLDKLLESVKVDRQIHENLKKRGTLEQRMINSDKLQLDIERQRRFIREIDKYITTADNCHQRGIRNELNGTSKK